MRPLYLKRAAIRTILNNVMDAIPAYLNTDDGSIIYITPSARATYRILIPDQANVEEAAGILADADHLQEWQRWDALNAAKVAAEDTPYRKIPLEDIDRAFDDMVEFIKTVRHMPLRERLMIDIEQEWPFKRFETTLGRHPGERDRWFQFQDKGRFGRFVLWLFDQGFYPEWDTPNDKPAPL